MCVILTQPNHQQVFSSSNLSDISREEFDVLKKEVEEMKQLLINAKIYDEKNIKPNNYEIKEKIKTLHKIADFMGINLDDILKK